MIIKIIGHSSSVQTSKKTNNEYYQIGYTYKNQFINGELGGSAFINPQMLPIERCIIGKNYIISYHTNSIGRMYIEDIQLSNS